MESWPLSTPAATAVGVGGALLRFPTLWLIFSPATDTFGCVVPHCAGPAFQELLLAGAEPLSQENCLSLQLSLFKMEGSSPNPRSAAFVCAHIKLFFFSGRHLAGYRQGALGKGSTNQGSIKLILTGFSTGTVFTISPVL